MSVEDAIAAELGDDDDDEAQVEDTAAPDDEAAAEDEAGDDGEQDALARVQEIDKKLDVLRKHVAKRMGEILGDDAQYYVEDPLSQWSGIPGWMPPMEVPPDVAAQLYHLLGQHSPTDYLDDMHSRVCGACNGFGEVRTGSKVIGQDRLPCVECKGLGWLPVDDERRAKGALAPNGIAASSTPPPASTSFVPDTPVEEDPEVLRLRQLGYAVIPPMVVNG